MQNPVRFKARAANAPEGPSTRPMMVYSPPRHAEKRTQARRRSWPLRRRARRRPGKQGKTPAPTCLKISEPTMKTPMDGERHDRVIRRPPKLLMSRLSTPTSPVMSVLLPFVGPGRPTRATAVNARDRAERLKDADQQAGWRQNKPASRLMVKARTIVLKLKETRPCTVPILRMVLATKAISAVCAATPMTMAKCRKSQ